MVVRSLVAEGLDVAILHVTPETRSCITLLIDPDSDALGAYSIKPSDGNACVPSGSAAAAAAMARVSRKREGVLKREESSAQADVLHSLGMTKVAHRHDRSQGRAASSGAGSGLLRQGGGGGGMTARLIADDAGLTPAEEAVLTDRIVRRALGKLAGRLYPSLNVNTNPPPTLGFCSERAL